jgi:hypothetical protein
MGMELYADWPVGELDEYHSFREKKFKNLYFCPSCSRSFETVAPTEKCKFCAGDIRAMTPIPTTESYTVEHDLKKRLKRILSGITNRFMKPKNIISKGSQKTLHEKYPVMQKISSETQKVFSQKRFYTPIQMKMPKIFSSRNKEELPTGYI